MELKALHQHGWTVTRLAHEYGLSRTTVYRELASPGPRSYAAREKPTALTEAQLVHIDRRLASCPDLRGTILHDELGRDYGYTASYPAFQRHLRIRRPAQIKDPEIRFETGPGHQTQADWAILGLFPLIDEMVELNAMVTILGCSRRPAIRFATDRTRPTTFERLFRCVDDMGGATRELLTDRDPAFCIGSTWDGSAILSPDWVDFAALLGVVPRACRPYRAKTKGKVERIIRELKEGFLGWLSGQIMPSRPTIADYDRFAARWIEEVVLKRRHRTTKRVVGEAWEEEREKLLAIPDHVRTKYTAKVIVLPAVSPAPERALGESVQLRDLSDYEVATR